MSDAFVAIDSGGTRTSVAVRFEADDEAGTRYETPEVLAGHTPPEAYSSTLRQILVRANRHLDEHDSQYERIYMFMGSAGFAQASRDHFADAFDEVLPELFEGRLAAAGAANDGTTLLLGQDADVVVIAGTGSTVMIMDGKNAIQIAGGHDWVGCDYGSGFWIGLRGIRQASRDFEDGAITDLFERFREVYSIRANHARSFVAKLRELAMADGQMKGEIARFAAAVCQAAERGDVPSQDIVKIEAEALADVAASAIRRRLGIARVAQGITVVQCGGLLSNEFYRAIFETQVSRRMMNAADEMPSIQWTRVDTGIASVMTLAERLRDDIDSLTRVDRDHVPLISLF